MKFEKIRLSFLLMIFSSVLYAQTATYSNLEAQYNKFDDTEQKDSALFYARLLNDWAFKNEGDTSLKYAVTLRLLGEQHGDSTLEYFKSSLEILERQNRSDHQEYAESLNRIGIYYRESGEFDKAESFFSKSLEIFLKTLGKNHPDYSKGLIDWAHLHQYKGDYKSAENLLKQALSLLKKAVGTDHEYYALCLNQIGLVYDEAGDYNKSEAFYKQALEIQKKKFGEEHSDYFTTLGNMGLLYLHMGSHKNAEFCLKKSADLSGKKYGEDHLDYAININNLGLFYNETANYNDAENAYKKALAIFEKVKGKLSSEYGTVLNNLGYLLFNKGDYQTAEKFLKESVEISKSFFGENHTNYAISLNNLGLLADEIGDYSYAETVFKVAALIYENNNGSNHPLNSTILNNLGNLYVEKRQFQLAESYLSKSLEINKIVYGIDSVNFATNYNSLGFLYMKMKDHTRALDYFKFASNLYKNQFGNLNPDYATSIANLAEINFNIGELLTAEQQFKESLSIFKKVCGEDHKKYVNAYENYAHFLARTGREKEACEIFKKILSKKFRQTIADFEWLSDVQKESYWKSEVYFYNDLYAFSDRVYEKVPEAAALNYNAALIVKSKLLESKISTENYYRELDEIREELAQKRRLIIKMESEGTEERAKLDKLRKEADQLDKKLTLSWPEYAEQKRNLSISWNQVEQNLEPGEAAIEFVRFADDNDTFYYNALLVRKGDKNPQLFKLCKESELRNIRPELGFSAYYPLVWKPMEAALQNIKTIYYSPVGDLNQVPFHAIYPAQGKGDILRTNNSEKRGNVSSYKSVTTEDNAAFLIDRFTLHQLTSTRYLAMGLKQKEKEPFKTSIAILGGVNYDYLPGSENQVNSEEKSKKDKNKKRSSESVSGKLDYLEGSKMEIEIVNNNLKSGNWETNLFEYNDATEENIVKLEGKNAKGLLHLATHGYAFPEHNFKDSIPKNSIRYSFRYSINPMVRSGLILAGGNWAWIGSDTLSKLGREENGILTALEVSRLNLKKTRLVVLSACETGLGTIDPTEGTFGLRRAFKLAGVEQMIVSLWSVPDLETKELMTYFYTDLLKSLNPIVSFDRTLREMRKKYPTEPEKWAGFVLVR